MDIGIKFSHYGEERDVDLNEEEVQAVELIFEILKDTVVNTNKLEVVRKSSSYATIVLRGNDFDFDFVRFKFTDKTKWITLNLSKNDRITYKDDPLFEAQKKKTQIHWKSALRNIEDLLKYKNLMINSYSEYVSRKK